MQPAHSYSHLCQCERSMMLRCVDCTQKNVRTIRQLQYTAWPDHGVPSSCDQFLEFVQVVRQDVQKHSTAGRPTLVHCRYDVDVCVITQTVAALLL